MIFENDKELSKAAVDKLIEATKKNFPQFVKDGMVMLKYAKNQYHKELQSEPPRISYPKSIDVPLVSTVTTENGARSYRYADNTIINTEGKVTGFNPSRITVEERMAITNIELLAWLWHFCPWVEECVNPDPSTICTLVIEDTRKDSILKNQDTRIQAKYLQLLVETKIELLKSIAISFDLTIDKDEEDAEVVMAIVSSYIGENKDRKLKFIEAVEGNEEIKESLNVTETLSDAEKLGIISYDPVVGKWLLNVIGKEPLLLHKTQSAKITTLYNHLLKTNEEGLKAIIEEVKVRQTGEE